MDAETSSSMDPRQAFWRDLIASSCRTANIGWCLRLFLPSLAVLGGLGVCTVFCLKRLHPLLWEASGLMWTVLLWSLGVVLAGVASFFFTRRRHLAPRQAAVLLDERLGLHCRLIMAYDGLRPWPEVPDKSGALLQLRAPAILPQAGLIMALIAAAILVPVAADAVTPLPLQPPVQWQRIGEALSTLAQQPHLDQTRIEALKTKLSELTRTPQKDWFSQAALEAADALANEVARTSEEAADNAARAVAALSEMQQSLQPLDPGASPAEQQEQQQERRDAAAKMSEAQKALLEQYMKMSQEMMQELADLNPQMNDAANGEQPEAQDGEEIDFSQLSAEDLEKMIKEMRECSRDLGQAARLCDADSECSGGSCDGECGECHGFGIDENGDPCPACRGTGRKKACRVGCKPGKGGVSRGPGEGGNPLGPDQAEKLGQRVEKAKSGRPAGLPGQVLATRNGGNRPDESSYTGPRSSGQNAHTGSGGSAVIRQQLLPAEQAALKALETPSTTPSPGISTP